MAERKSQFKTEYRNVSVKTVDGSILFGKINIGIKSRVSEIFTQTDSPFIVLSSIKKKEGSNKVLLINKNHIVWVEPKD